MELVSIEMLMEALENRDAKQRLCLPDAMLRKRT